MPDAPIEFNTFLNVDSDNKLLDDLIAQGVQFDLICTDPPYNLSKDFGNQSDNLELGAFLEINRQRIQKCAQLLTPTGSLLYFAIHHYVGHLQVMMYDTGLHYRRMNIWRYENGFSRSTNTLRGEYEPFLWFSKHPKKWNFNVDDVRVPYKSTERLKNPVFYKNSRGERVAWEPNPLGSMRGDIWEFPALAGKRFANERTEHPTQKPESLMTELLKAFCPKNEAGQYTGRVLDPYAGSGTTGICCEKLNRNGHQIQWLCGELEARWVGVANERLRSVHATIL